MNSVLDNKIKIATIAQKEIFDKIKEYKEIVEGNIIGSLWKKPELLDEFDEIGLEHFIFNKWRVFWQILYDLYVVENKKEIDEAVVSLYLAKHPKLKEKYEEYGGWETINTLSNDFTKVDNIHSYVDESHKWNAVIKMLFAGFPITNEKLSSFVDMSLDDIYDEYESMLNHIFISTNTGIEAYDISEGIDELYHELNDGDMIGLSYYNMPLLTNLTNGACLGNITLLGAPSGMGKSSFLRNAHMTATLKAKERIVIMINEEGRKKWQKEFICWVANNIFQYNLQKYQLNNGNFDDETSNIILKSINWIKQNTANGMITLVPFKRYSTNLALKCIRKYASMGVKYFAIDTFKTDSDATADDWALLEKNMVAIYDLIKPENKNVHIFITLQLKPSDIRERYLTIDNTAKAKGVAEVASTFIMIRRLFDDEMPGGSRELNVYKNDGALKELATLQRDKRYYIAFIAKNREGESGYRQIVFENDLNRNVMKEIGWTIVPFTS